MSNFTAWLDQHRPRMLQDLADLVAIPSISTDGEHQADLDSSAGLVCELMARAGLQKVEILRAGDSNPYAYAEWLGAPGKPTVFLYAHHDVQPVNFENQWESPPWELTARGGRLYGRGSADDKGAIIAQVEAVASFLKTTGRLPVNVKMLVEGEEEVGSSNLMGFFQQHRQRLISDVIVVCDTENIEVGHPSITYSLRGLVALKVDVKSARDPIHSGMGGGAIADAALALNVILSRLYWNDGPPPVPGLYDQVRSVTGSEKETISRLPWSEGDLRKGLGVLPEVRLPLPPNRHFYEQTWRHPALTVIAQEASSLKGASNQVLPTASAIVSCRIVPDQDPQKVFEAVKAVLTDSPPWGVQVEVTPHGKPVKWWMTDPNGPAFEAALQALEQGYRRPGVAIGCGGTIGFVGPLAELFDSAPALLLGIEDPGSNAHAPNEGLHEADWYRLMDSLALLFDNLGRLPAVK